MIDDSTFDFLKKLRRNNSRDWFDDHRDGYEAARANLIEVAAKLHDKVSRFDDAISQSGFDDSSVMRLNRDMRFTKDKTPYKTGFYVLIKPSGNFQRLASYYLFVEPGGSYVGGGIYRTESEPLSKIRDRISGRFEDWKKAVESAAVRKMFPDGVQAPDVLKTHPQGYSQDDPAIGYLNLKGFALNHYMSDATMMEAGALDEWTRAMKTASPLVAFINEAVKKV